MRARSALFTVFGDVVRPSGGDAWLSTLTGCMGALGFTPEATRTALHRMAAEGWVEPRREGRYAAYQLTARGVDRLEEAAARIYRLRGADWDGRWRLLVCPAAARSSALQRELSWMGFGRLSSDAWISPHPHGDRLRTVLTSAGLDGEALNFVTDVEEGGSDRDAQIVERAWDLGELQAAHTAFIDRWQGVDPPSDLEAAFVARIRLVHEWRSFLFLDPGLPVTLLPAVGWRGEEAADCFRTLYEAVEAPSWRFYDDLIATAPTSSGGRPPRGRRDPAASPFARGLEALQTRRPASVPAR